MFNLSDSQISFLRKRRIIDADVTQDNVDEVLEELALLVSAGTNVRQSEEIITTITTSNDW